VHWINTICLNLKKTLYLVVFITCDNTHSKIRIKQLLKDIHEILSDTKESMEFHLKLFVVLPNEQTENKTQQYTHVKF
jgi:hypothetical protein